jgi:hypothetical protein
VRLPAQFEERLMVGMALRTQIHQAKRAYGYGR